MISVLLKAGRNRILPSVFGSIALIATADWAIGNRASLGLLYMLPMMAAATVLSAGPVVALAAACSALRSWFDIPAPQLEILLRFVFAFAAYAGSGLFVIGLIRTRTAEMEHQAKIRREQETAARSGGAIENTGREQPGGDYDGGSRWSRARCQSRR